MKTFVIAVKDGAIKGVKTTFLLLKIVLPVLCHRRFYKIFACYAVFAKSFCSGHEVFPSSGKCSRSLDYRDVYR